MQIETGNVVAFPKFQNDNAVQLPRNEKERKKSSYTIDKQSIEVGEGGGGGGDGNTLRVVLFLSR